MTNQSKLDELEQRLLKDGVFQHILKFAPQSQRELMTFELARYITDNYTPNSEVERQVREARIEELTGLLSMQKNKPRRVLLKDAVNIAYSRVCELSDVKNLHKEQSNDQL